MTTIARPATSPLSAYAPPTRRSYAHAHWYFLASFLVIVAGFWPTFFRSAGSGTVIKNVHVLLLPILSVDPRELVGERATRGRYVASAGFDETCQNSRDVRDGE